jgi:Tfp pilus assembly PilM family ATPase
MFPGSFQKIASLFRTQKLGWIGMDIGPSAIHLAQVERAGNHYVLNLTWTAYPTTGGKPPASALASLEDGSDRLAQTDGSTRLRSPSMTAGTTIPEDPQHAIEGLIEHARKAKTLFHQSPLAFTVADGNIDYREFELDVSDLSDRERAVTNELEKEPGFDIDATVVRAWELPGKGRTRPKKQSTAVVSAPYDFTMWIGEMVTRAGYAPEVLDAVPCALARASEMFLGGADHPCLVVHIGNAYTTLSLAQHGIPIITRVLKQHGFEKVLMPLGTEFAIRQEEVNFLLLKLLEKEAERWQGASDLTEIVYECQLRFLQSLAKEIYRTLEYIRSELTDSEPTGLILCGNGSIMPNAAVQLEQLLEIPTEPWRLSMGESGYRGNPASLYAVAAGLSAIAWETA